MSSSSTSNDAKPSSDSASDDRNVVALTTAGLPIRIANLGQGYTPWMLAPGTWAERARVG